MLHLNERHTGCALSGTTLRHDAFVYESDEEFADRMTPFAVAGLRDGEAVVAVTTAHNARASRWSAHPTA